MLEICIKSSKEVFLSGVQRRIAVKKISEYLPIHGWMATIIITSIFDDVIISWVTQQSRWLFTGERQFYL